MQRSPNFAVVQLPLEQLLAAPLAVHRAANSAAAKVIVVVLLVAPLAASPIVVATDLEQAELAVFQPHLSADHNAGSAGGES